MIERGDLFWMLTHRIHDNWVAYFSGYGAAKVFIDIVEELTHTETNPTC